MRRPLSIQLFRPAGAIVVRSPTDESTTIHSVEDWYDFAPPMGRRKHWKDGRSAKEVAKAWCTVKGIAAPAELLALLRSHPSTFGFRLATVIPECRTHLRGESGGPRRHDLVLFGTASAGRVLVGVEAKA